MKRLFFVLCLFTSLAASAKKVKFSVNMEFQVVDTGGVHVTGDFQDEAGYPADWDAGTTAMVQDANDTNIYWVVVDIPAFRVYEFKYVNGIHGYQQEFVPVESRVNYNFIDSRWFYVDSLSNDTMDWGAIRYAGNAPAGKNLIRFYVDMSNETVNSSGVHVATALNSWSTTAARMYSYDGSVWEYIAFADSGLTVGREYKFLNGNTAGNYEALAGWCANGSGNREVVAPRDTMLPAICYTFCAACSTIGISEVSSAVFGMSPNPAADLVNLTFANNSLRTISVIDAQGREVAHAQTNGETTMNLSIGTFAPGIYFTRVMESNGRVQVQKLIVE